jgi:23S rRNA pseudouridine1911/1915/1917 synthase
MSSTLSVIIGENPPARLDKALARDVPAEASLSRSRLMKLLADGAISRAGEVITEPRAKVREGDEFVITIEEAAESHMGPEDIPLDVIYEDDDLIVINKPVGMVVHPAPGTPGGTLVNALLHYCGDSLSGVGGEKRPGIVHRIDKDTSGLLVVAKSDKAHHGLAAQFEKHTVERKYAAIVYGVPDSADPRLRGVKGVNFEGSNIMRITTQLARHKTDRQRQAVLFQGGRHAVTRAREVERFGAPAVATLVECWLETGRTHQIRVHLTHAGHCLVGDQTYGGKRKLNAKALTDKALAAVASFPRQALHAAVLGFEHPVSGEVMRFEAPLPEDMAALVEILRQKRQ